MNKKNLLTLILGLLCSLSLLQAQKISREKVFPLTGYYVNTVGYPSALVPMGKDKFAFVEYWVRGTERKETGYYLQGYDTEFNENWAQITSKPGTAPLDVFHLTRMKENIALLGHQYNPASKKQPNTMVQFYSPDGVPKGGLIKMSNYDKKAKKGYEDYLAQSVDGGKILWMGHNPNDSYKKRNYFFSVWSDDGRQTWGKKLVLPFQDQKYKAKQATVDEKGNLYLLMEYEIMTNSVKDTLFRPVILRYDSRENKFTQHALNFRNSSFPDGRIHINQDGDLIFLGILSDGSEGGFLNGAKSSGVPLKWNKIVYKKFNISRELTLTEEKVIDLPENWMNKYAKNGANFSKSELIENQGRLYWIMEEFYTQIHNKQLQYAYNDVGVITLDMKKGEIIWANTFSKLQRDYSSGRLLSYVAGISPGKLNFVYLNERGAQGKIVCTSFNLNTGETTSVDLARNQESKYLFFPKRSAMINSSTMVLMGVGDPVGNDYKLIKITF
ncbi:MAG: hypothetical protein H6581_26020 [Bacteroidia bacterium]|nr:hypothetical protein [Bacteroidia bacterium]